MSTSISLGTSADLESLTSGSFQDSENNVARTSKTKPKNFLGTRLTSSNRHHFNSPQRLPATAQQSPQPSKYPFHLKNPNLFEHHYTGGPLGASRKESAAKNDFYAEVDERMSRNSFEYPEQQAKYVGQWLDNLEYRSKSRSVEDDSSPNWGNVVGVRGFGTQMNGEESREEREQRRAKYNKLKFDHLKLQSDHDKLGAKLGETISKYKRIFKKKDHDIELLRAFIDKHNRRSRDELGRQAPKECTCNCCCNRAPPSVTPNEPVLRSKGADEESDRLKLELRRLQTKLSIKDEEHEERIKLLKDENSRLREQADRTKAELEIELTNLKSQIRALSLEPEVKLMLALRNENGRLKDFAEVGEAEYEALKENYERLESQLKSMVEDQRCLDEEKNAEIQKLIVELCRLQVSQPKLEALLHTERQIKAELQTKIRGLSGDNDKLKEQAKSLASDLNQERMRSKKTESVEVGRLQQELMNWQEKYHRLAKEKSDVEDLLRNSKSRMAQMDSKHQSEMDLLKELSRGELDKLQGNVSKLEGERNRYLSELDRLKRRLSENQVDRDKLTCELMETSRKLEIALCNQNSNDAIAQKLKESEERTIGLANQLESAQMTIRDMKDELANCRERLERANQRLEQLQHRFQLQQQAFDDLSEKRDKELSKLRVNLNFEQYNRQVALKGIEKELRASLKELEAMKCRFSRRLAQSEPVGGANVRLDCHSSASPSSSPRRAQQAAAAANSNARLISGPFREGDTSS